MLEIKKEGKNEMEFVLENEDHTLAQMLLSYLYANPDVDIAQYRIPHPQVGKPEFYLKVKKGKPRDVLAKVLEKMERDLKGLKIK